MVLFPVSNRHVHAISIDGGDPLWSTWYRGLTSTMPVVTEDAFYLSTGEEFLAFEPREARIGTSDIGGWNTPGGNPAYTRYRSHAATIRDEAPIEFEVQLESDFRERFITGPLLVSEGKVMAWMVARDALTGEVIWRPPGFLWPQAVTGTVCAMSGFQGTVLGVSMSDGGVKWDTAVGEKPFRVNAADGKIIATHPNEGARALAAESGEVLWSTDEHGGAWQPLIGKDAVYVPDPDEEERIRSYDLASGDELAARDVPALESIQRGGRAINWPPEFDGGQRMPLLGDEQVFLPAAGTVVALDRSTLETDWQREITTTGSVSAAALAFDGDRLYYTFSDGIVALDPGSGETRWEREMDSSPSDLIVGGDTMYVPAWQTLHGVDPDSGADMWTRDFDDVLAEMALGDDRLFIRSKSPPMEDPDPRLRVLTA